MAMRFKLRLKLTGGSHKNMSKRSPLAMAPVGLVLCSQSQQLGLTVFLPICLAKMSSTWCATVGGTGGSKGRILLCSF